MLGDTYGETYGEFVTAWACMNGLLYADTGGYPKFKPPTDNIGDAYGIVGIGPGLYCNFIFTEAGEG